MKQWKRKIDVILGGKKISDDLTIEFDVNFSEAPDVDLGSLRIYNLSKSTVGGLKKGIGVNISAGYEKIYGNIFSGVALDVQTSWNGVDKVTEVLLGDASVDYRRLRHSKSFAEGTTNDEVLMYLLSRAGLGIGDFDTVKDTVFKNGVQVSGMIHNAIERHVRISESRFYINKGRAYIRPKNKPNGMGFLLDKDSGLIDIPEPIETEIDGEVYRGFKVTCLLNHQINVDNIVMIKSKTANGAFRVSSGTHSGGNFTNEFYTTMEVYPA